MVPKIEVTAKAPSNVAVKPTGSPEITREVGVEIQPVADADAFLLPTWDRGFWVMPPGGFTRFFFPAPGFINPDMCHPSR